MVVIDAESTCSVPEPQGGMLAGGSLSVPITSCPIGSSLEYSIGNGWSNALPTYNQTSSMTMFTRCVCDTDSNTTSNNASITTTPGVCPDCPKTANAGSFDG